ncbi:NPC intracellular cholesterol transporter 2 homolog a-like [Mytilus edulis]|uniref:NPC intracellular cholesterol transporter 2 homolog a-like n=1 Tax=Mytilus edulis TaxID=6550 RepID=UPI0039F08C85
MKYIVLILITVVCTVKGTNVVFSDCGTTTGKHRSSGHISSVNIQCANTDSSTKSICMLKHNASATISVNFTSDVNTTQVKTFVHGILGGFLDVLLHLVSHDGEDGVRFLGVKEDACIDKAVDHCNIEAGETVQYTNTMFISPLYPLRRLDVKWEIRDDQDRDLACIKMPAEIVA